MGKHNKELKDKFIQLVIKPGEEVTDTVKRRAYQRMKRDQIMERRRLYRLDNKDKLNTQAKAWREANPEIWKAKHKEAKKTRRARKRGVITQQIRPNFLAFATECFGGACAYCRRSSTEAGPLELDHFVPLARGGAHAEHNLVPACHRCNTEKSARDPFSFLHNREIDRRHEEAKAASARLGSGVSAFGPVFGA